MATTADLVSPGSLVLDGTTPEPTETTAKDKAISEEKKKTPRFFTHVPSLVGINCCGDTTDAAKGDDDVSQSTISEKSQDAALTTEKDDSPATASSWTQSWSCFAFEGMERVMFDLDGLCGNSQAPPTPGKDVPPTIDVATPVTTESISQASDQNNEETLQQQNFLEMEPNMSNADLSQNLTTKTKQVKVSEYKSADKQGIRPTIVAVTLDPLSDNDAEEIRQHLLQPKRKDQGLPVEPQETAEEVDHRETLPSSNEKSQPKSEQQEVQSNEKDLSCVLIFHNIATGSFCEGTDPVDTAAEADQEHGDDGEADDSEAIQKRDDDKEERNEKNRCSGGGKAVQDVESESAEAHLPRTTVMTTVVEAEDEELEGESEDKEEHPVKKMPDDNFQDEKNKTDQEKKSPGGTRDDKDLTSSESSVSLNIDEDDSEPVVVIKAASIMVGREMECDEASATEANEFKDGIKEPKAKLEEPGVPKVKMVSLVTGVLDSIDSVVPFN